MEEEERLRTEEEEGGLVERDRHREWKPLEVEMGGPQIQEEVEVCPFQRGEEEEEGQVGEQDWAG